MKNPVAIETLALATALALVAGCSSPAPTNVGPQVATADNENIAPPTQPPPEDQHDVIPVSPGPRPLWYFIPGHWAWRGQWVWVPGHWRPRPHPGDIWVRGKWDKQGNIYVWEKGHWRSGAPADEESNEM